MKKALALLAAAALLTGCLPAFAEEDYDGLYELAEPYGFLLGAPLSWSQLGDSRYLDMVSRHFNSVTMTNEMKAYSLLDEQASRMSADGMPVMNYTMADQMVQWAQDNFIGVRGHVLVWDAYMCDWFFREGYSASKPYADRETVMARTQYYIREVMTHFETKFPGTVYCWDVVNEAVADGENEYAEGDPRHLRTMRSGTPNLFREYLGDDYVSWAFLWAKDTAESLGADIRLYYNDYNAYFPAKAEAIRSLIAEVNSFAKDENGGKRVLCDGVGMQGYIGGYGVQQGCLEQGHPDLIRQAMLAYAAMGLEVQVTEMAVRNFDLSQAELHADFYAKIFQVFMQVNAGEDRPLKAVSIWGLQDTNAPRGTYVYNLNSPYGGLFDLRMNYKDAFRRVYETLARGL